MAYDAVKVKNDNRDPITKEPGAHPIGSGVGAAVGAAAGIAGAAGVGAAAGTALGPIGTIAGGLVGGVVGGLAGKGVAEEINPTAEDAYWRENYKTRTYVESNDDYTNYQSAYMYGVDAYSKNKDSKFDKIEPDLSTGWDKARGKSTLGWDKAKNPARDAYDRLRSRNTNSN